MEIRLLARSVELLSAGGKSDVRRLVMVTLVARNFCPTCVGPGETLPGGIPRVVDEWSIGEFRGETHSTLYVGHPLRISPDGNGKWNVSFAG